MNRLFNVSNFHKQIHETSFIKSLVLLYGESRPVIESAQKRYLKLLEMFVTQFPEHENFRIFSAPGRTEIAGNHTDHQGGHVLCASVDLDIIAFVAITDTGIIRIKSEGHHTLDLIDTNDLEPIDSEIHRSSALIRGVAAGFKQHGLEIGSFDAFTTSNVPKGSGLSSSAAFEILVSSILNRCFNNGEATCTDMAIISQFAENKYFGKPCGLMDQCGCCFGGIMTIDFKAQSMPCVKELYVDFNKFGYSIVITNTGGSHSGLNAEYAAIPADMSSVASFFGKGVLSEVSHDEFKSQIVDVVQKCEIGAVMRAIHYFADDLRVIEQANALEIGDINRFLQLIRESGVSSWTLLRNVFSPSRPDLQQLALGLALSGDFLGNIGASRVHGGGFAGTIQAFVANDRVNEYINYMNKIFGSGAAYEVRVRNLPATEPFMYL